MKVGDLVKPAPHWVNCWRGVGLIISQAASPYGIFWCVLVHGDRVVMSQTHLEVVGA